MRFLISPFIKSLVHLESQDVEDPSAFPEEEVVG